MEKNCCKNLYCWSPFFECQCKHVTYGIKNIFFAGLQEVNNDLKTLSIPLHLFLSKEPTGNILTFVKEHKIGCVVIDFSPLRLPKDWAKKLKEALPENIPLCQVGTESFFKETFSFYLFILYTTSPTGHQVF